MSLKPDRNEQSPLLHSTAVKGSSDQRRDSSGFLPVLRRTSSVFTPGSIRGSPGIHLKVPRRRSRAFSTNSLGIFNEDGDVHIVSTSFGSAVVHLDTSPGLAWDWYLGLFLGLFSGLLFTANNFFLKFFSLDPAEMLLVRSALQAFLIGVSLSLGSKAMTTSSSWLGSLKQAFIPESCCDQVLVCLQGILGGLRVYLTFACLPFMPLGDALTLVFTEPLWTIILSKFILKIRIGLWKILFGLILVSGVVLCVKPPFLFPAEATGETLKNSSSVISSAGNFSANSTSGLEPSLLSAKEAFGEQSDILRINAISEADHQNFTSNDSSGEDPGTDTYFLGAGLAIGAALTGSLANILIAKCEVVTSSVLVFYSGMGGVIVALLCSIFDSHNSLDFEWRIPGQVQKFFHAFGFVFDMSLVSLHDWLVLLSLGASGMIGYFCMTRSLQLIPPTTVAVLRALEIVLAYLVEALVMGVIPDLLSISGSTFVGVSVIAIALEDQIKNILKFLFDKIKGTLTCFSSKKDIYCEI